MSDDSIHSDEVLPSDEGGHDDWRGQADHAVPVDADEQTSAAEIDLAAPAQRGGPRRSLLLLAIVSAVALGIAGFALGRASNDQRDTKIAATPSPVEPAAAATAVATGPKTIATATVTTPSASDTTAVTIGLPLTGEANGTTPAMAATTVPAGAVTVTFNADGSKTARMPSGGGFMGGAYEEQPGTLLTTRTVGNIALAAYQQSYPNDVDNQPYGGQFPNWKPAGWCFPSGNLRISIVTPQAVNVSGGVWYAEPKDGLAVSTFAAGYVESHPVFGVGAQVDATATMVTLTTSDHRTDAAAPQNGLALLAVEGRIATDFTVSVTHADGTKTEMSSAGSQPNASVQRDFNDNCQPPPPALPDAGAQPADPAAAEAAVRAAFAKVYSFGSDPKADRAAVIDDTTGLADATERLLNGGFADAGKSSTGDIKALVFTSPTEAWFRYDLSTSATSFAGRYGQAHLGQDGLWKVSRQTICQDLMLAPGAECSPAVTQLLPPSAATDPRYNHDPNGGVAIAETPPAPVTASANTKP